MSEITSQKTANAGPLGLIGFGSTTVLLCLSYAGIIPDSVVIIAMAFALGGLAQFIGGILEFKHGNTFGGTVFTVYGFFWWSLIFILLNPGNVAAGADSISLGFYLLLWAFITFLFFIAALKLDRTTQAVLCTLTLVFLGLSIANFSGAPEVLTVTAWLGVICGLIAIYGAMAQVINEVHGKTVFPLGLPK